GRQAKALVAGRPARGPLACRGMRAAVLEHAGDPLVLHDDVTSADPRRGEVRVQVRPCGVCHSDLSIAAGVFPAPTPIVLGHEAAGIVDAGGADVEGLAAGALAALDAVAAC